VSDRRIIDMPPPPIVRRRIEDLRHLVPPASLLDAVLTEVDETPQAPRTPRWITTGAAVAVAAAVVVAAFLLTRSGNVGNESSASPSTSPSAASAGGTPTPIDELPVAGALQTTIPTAPFDILTLGAFDSVWLADPGAGAVKRLDPGTNELDATYQVRPEGGDTRLWLAATDDLLWVGTGGSPSLVALDPETGTVEAELDLGVDPFTLSADDTEVWLTDIERGLVIGVDAATGNELHRVEVPGPTGISVGATSVWVASTDTNAVIEVDRASGEILRTIQVGPTPMQVFVDPDGTSVYVVGRDGMPVGAIDVATGDVRRGAKELVALTFVGGAPWGLLPSGLFMGPLDPRTLEFTAGVSLPTPSGENLVFSAGSLWTQDAEQVYRVRPAGD
jgi:hypothetical protein